MTKKKSDSLKISKNKRVSPYGEYYIKSKTIKSGFTLSPLEIELIFETGQKKCQEENIRYICHLNFGMMFTSQYDSHYNTQKFITIYFPNHTTSQILQYRNLVELLAADKDIDRVIIDIFLDTSTIRGHPSNPLLSKTLLERHIVDVELSVKLKSNYPIIFEDIEGAQNMEIREQALKKFGYEDYVKEGFWKKKIICVIFNNHDNLYINPSFNMDYYDEFRRTVLSRRDDEKIICFSNDIAFLQVKDTSTNKTHFLKVPPTMQSVGEAKAWTFGLNPEEYNPVVET